MSIEAESETHELIIERLLEKILEQLDLLNARYEKSYDTGIELDNIEE